MGSVSADSSAHSPPILLNKDVSESNSSSDSASESPKETVEMMFHDSFPNHDSKEPFQASLDQDSHEEPVEPSLPSNTNDSDGVDGVEGTDGVVDQVVATTSSNSGVAPVPTAGSAVTESLTEQAACPQPPVSGSFLAHSRADSTSRVSSHSRTNSRSSNRPVVVSSHSTNACNSSGQNSAGSGAPDVVSAPENGSENRGASRISVARRSSLSFFSNWANTIRGQGQINSRTSGAPASPSTSVDPFMSNSPTIANLSSMAGPGPNRTLENYIEEGGVATRVEEVNADTTQLDSLDNVMPPQSQTQLAQPQQELQQQQQQQLLLLLPNLTQSLSMTTPQTLTNLDGVFSVRLTPIIDHSSSNSGLYFSPIIRRLKPNETIAIGRYTEKNKSAAHAPQGSSQPIVFKSKVVSRTHALFQCKSDGLWHLKDCKSSSGTFLNNVRLSQATMELEYWPVFDGDTIQLGLDYRGGSEDIYRCVKMRCEFNHSWQRKVNQYNLEIHERMKNLRLDKDAAAGGSKQQASECAICLLTLDPCQALFISPCSHSWHYKCIRPVIIKSYPQFYCPNCRSMCDLETDIEDEV